MACAVEHTCDGAKCGACGLCRVAHVLEVADIGAEREHFAASGRFKFLNGANAGCDPVSRAVAAQVAVPFGARWQGIAGQERDARFIRLHQVLCDRQPDAAIAAGDEVVPPRLQRQVACGRRREGYGAIVKLQTFFATPSGGVVAGCGQQLFEQARGDWAGLAPDRRAERPAGTCGSSMSQVATVTPGISRGITPAGPEIIAFSG